MDPVENGVDYEESKSSESRRRALRTQYPDCFSLSMVPSISFTMALLTASPFFPADENRYPSSLIARTKSTNCFRKSWLDKWQVFFITNQDAP